MSDFVLGEQIEKHEGTFEAMGKALAQSKQRGGATGVRVRASSSSKDVLVRQGTVTGAVTMGVEIG